MTIARTRFVILLLAALALVGCDELFGVNFDGLNCDNLREHVIDLHKESTNPFLQRIIWIDDDFRQLSRTDGRLECEASVRTDRGGSETVKAMYYAEVAGDDVLIGSELRK